MAQTPTDTLKGKAYSPIPPSSRPASKSPKERGRTLESHPAAEFAPSAAVRDLVEKRELVHMLKQSQELLLATAAQQFGHPRHGFMKCLLEVEEEEEALHRRATKAQGLPNRKSARALIPVPTSGSSLSPFISQHPPVVTMASSWVRLPTPAPVSSSMGVPELGSVLGLPIPALDMGWKRTELLLQKDERNFSQSEQEEHNLMKLFQNWEERLEEQLTIKQEEAFRSYFEIFKGHGEVDAQSLENILLYVGIPLMPTQVEAALISADVDGDGHVTFKDFLTVMTDNRRFFSSVEENTLTDTAPLNPHTLFFEILSLLVEMLALPEATLEEITSYYQKKLKEVTAKAQEMELAVGRLRARKKLSLEPQEEETLVEIPDRRVLRVLNRLKQNYEEKTQTEEVKATGSKPYNQYPKEKTPWSRSDSTTGTNLQSPCIQMPCIPLCPRLEAKTISRKQSPQYVLDPSATTCLSTDIRSLLFQAGSQGSREYSSDSQRWLSSVLARTH